MNEHLNQTSALNLHEWPGYSAPYRVSRLAPAIHPGEPGTELAKADLILSAPAVTKLRVIAD